MVLSKYNQWENFEEGKTEQLGDKPVPVPLLPSHISHGLTWD